MFKTDESVEEMLKQNKVELQRLNKEEMKMYLECEKEFTIMQGVFSPAFRMKTIDPGPVPPFNPDTERRVITLRDIPYTKK